MDNKQKLIDTIQRSKEDAVQAIELNRVLGILSEREIDDILESLTKRKGWVGETLVDKVMNLDNEWQSFLGKQKYLDSAGSVRLAMKDGFYPIVHGRVRLPFGTNKESLADYGRKIGDPLILAEEKVLSWLKKHPLVEKVSESQIQKTRIESGFIYVYWEIEIELVSLSKILF